MVLLSQNEQLLLLTALLEGCLQNSYIYVLRVGKNQPFTKRLLKLLRVIRIDTKFANFAGLDFPIKFRDQTLQFY